MSRFDGGSGRALPRAVIVAVSIRVMSAFAVTVGCLSVTGWQRWVLLVLAVIASASRLRPRVRWRTALAAAVALLCIAAITAALSGGLPSLAFGGVILATADIGIIRGGAAGAFFGMVGTVLTELVATASLVWIVHPAPIELWLLLLVPSAGLAFGTVHADQTLAGAAAMRATTAALDDLVRLTERMPAGADLWSVGSAILAEVRDVVAPVLPRGTMASNQPHVLVGRAGVLRGVGPPWDRRPLGLVDELPRQRRGQPFAMVELAALPEAMQGQLVGQQRWFVHRLAMEAGDGAVLVPGTAHPRTLPGLLDVLRLAGMALANVDRFERLQLLASNAARNRLAHDLHDGVAQALTHVRFELELLELEADNQMGVELARVRTIADAALLEVRRSVGELRELTTLSAAVVEYVHALRSFARAQIELTISGDFLLPELIQREVFRVVQESMSNALRHSGGTNIDVTLERDDQLLQLFVEDDGRGIATDNEQGVGLSAMGRRAERLGGRLVVRPRRGGGTVVHLSVPLDPPGPDGGGVKPSPTGDGITA